MNFLVTLINDMMIDVPLESRWWDVWNFFWYVGQIVVRVLWRFPTVIHDKALSLTGWRIVKVINLIDDELLKYDITDEYPPLFSKLGFYLANSKTTS